MVRVRYVLHLVLKIILWKISIEQRWLVNLQRPKRFIIKYIKNPKLVIINIGTYYACSVGTIIFIFNE